MSNKMEWQHGYYADSGYTYDYHIETSPARLGWIAAVKGFRHISKKFRYLDLGCGQGLSVISMAALHPDSEFIGIDFMPEHIAHAKQLVKDTGLTNINFIEGDFIELTQSTQLLGEFDYVVAHGISTWVSPLVRDAMFELASKALKPGGMMYNSYNTYPGWLPMAPFQQLVIQLQSKYSGNNAIQIAQEKINSLQKLNSPIFETIPTLQSRLDKIKTLNQAYLVQEYNNAHWQPVYSNQMLNIAAKYKLELMSTASLPEIFEGCYPKPMWDFINSENDLILKEFYRDLVLAQNFRRDIYIKGGLRYWIAEASSVIDEQKFSPTQLMSIPIENECFNFKSGPINIEGNINVYKPILDNISEDGVSFAELLVRHPEHTRESLIEVVSLLIHGNWIGVMGDNDFDAAKKLNTTVAKAALQGAPYAYLCCPKIQTAFKFNQLDLIIFSLINQGFEKASLPAKLALHLKKINKKVTITNSIHDEEKQVESKLKIIINDFIEKKYDQLLKLGAI
jgi:ubiquinone/menaquinone biosynthesis C-methylase UbiE